MHNLKLKTSMALLAVGTLTSSAAFAAETKTKPVKEDTIEIISTEIATAEEPAVNDIKPQVDKPEKATNRPVPVKETEPIKEVETEKTETEKTETVKTVTPVETSTTVKQTESVKEVESEKSVESSEEAVPAVEHTEQSQVMTEQPSTEQPVTEAPQNMSEQSEVQDVSIEAVREDDHKIEKGSFSPHKGEKYYASLDKEVNQLVTKKLDEVSSKKSKALPDSGEHHSLYFGVGLLALGLMLTRRIKLQK